LWLPLACFWFCISPYASTIISGSHNSVKQDLKQQAENAFLIGKPENSLHAWLQIQHLDPKRPEAPVRIAELYIWLGDRQNAQKTFADYYAKNRQWLTPIQIAWFEEKWKNALEWFLSDEGQTLFLRAQMHVRKKEWEQSRSLLQMVLQKEPSNLAVLKELGFVHKALGQDDGYRDTVLKRETLFPCDRQLSLELAEAYIFSGDFSRAIESIIEHKPEDRSKTEKVALAFAFSKVGRTKEAKEIIKSILAGQKSETLPAIAYRLLSSWDRPDSPEKSEWHPLFEKTYQKEKSQRPGKWDPYHLDPLFAS
jgi:tetratricopeptide (TPR) repeat protein